MASQTVSARTVCVTGVGLVSSLAHGVEEHVAQLQQRAHQRPPVDYMGYAIRQITHLDLEAYIPKPGDRRAMLPTMHYGVVAAGMALADAQMQEVKGTQIDLVVACDGGDRDYQLDEEIDEKAFRIVPDREALLNRSLMNGLRPTLFLSQIPNLLAGNISIVHGPSRTSRTFMGQELAGAAALRDGFQRVRSGASDIMLVGGASNAERRELLESYCALGLLSEVGQGNVWAGAGRGIVPGSMGAFLVLEPYEKVLGGERKVLAILDGVTNLMEDRSVAGWRSLSLNALVNELGIAKGSRWGALSGASGLARLADDELNALRELSHSRPELVGVRAPADVLGYGFEAAMIANVALACLALRQQSLYPPVEDVEAQLDRPGGPLEKILVTSLGVAPVAAAALLSLPKPKGS